MTIQIGLTGWGDHPSLYTDPVSSSEKLTAYASHFPVVEVDSAFYAIQPEKNYRKWMKQTPDSFSFVIKAFQGLTGHDRKDLRDDQMKSLLDAYIQSISPVMEAKKLNAILFQFPPWFKVDKENIHRLRVIRDYLSSYPLALEFRNRSWFQPKYKEKTIAFMKEEKWIHSICDEPQAGEGSVPTILEPTHEKTLIRFHGRNVHGWNKNGRDNWREVRFLYRYNQKELLEWVKWIQTLQQNTKDITILFNNNSGGDAADNAKQLINLLGIEYVDLNPRQMDLFEGEI
ncbi:uncharacterized protein YecE (DUF72 family) [Salirhabdus euzebyi]|uniref:Uncharacterized protein YecE (DUF72 family) n=1 Tax=Salirhabdus euzebyi TaxID=394506 RepID=A0A841PTV8_9BACI|nr:DUF72 domain-containing protein [Salirhabdus euzebyi]MBB6452269.1 uncharacterized protein YecE (DUF72 family) [Salirhabdus euzebyi]